MKLTVDELFSINRALGELSQLLLPMHKAFQIAQLQKVCNDTLQPIETIRLSMLKRFGVPDMAGNYSIPEENQTEFNAEVAKMLAIEVEIPDKKIDLTDCSEVKVKPAVLFVLSKLIEFKEASS